MSMALGEISLTNTISTYLDTNWILHEKCEHLLTGNQQLPTSKRLLTDLYKYR